VRCAGADHTAGITSGGALLTWGNGQQGQLGRVGERLSDRVKLETLLAPHAVPFKRTRWVAARGTQRCRCFSREHEGSSLPRHTVGCCPNAPAQTRRWLAGCVSCLHCCLL
jgi:hypothetical protein